MQTTAVGFGCASLFSAGDRSSRRRILEAAYDAGVRHFDLAPIYGMGLAEEEFAPFLRRHRDDITLTTKFGLGLTRVGRLAGRIQQPVRAALRASSAAKQTVQHSGQSATSGIVGALLYRRPGLSAAAVQQSLDASLRRLGTDRIDAFLLHEPPSPALDLSVELMDYLDLESARGRIGAWGLAGEAVSVDAVGSGSQRVGVYQTRYDLLTSPAPSAGTPTRTMITYGALSRVLPTVGRLLAEQPDVLAWAADLDVDLHNRPRLASLLLRQAATANPHGVVLVSTARIDHLSQTLEGITTPLSATEQEAVGRLATTLLSQHKGDVS